MDFLTDSVAAIAARVQRRQQSAREVTEHALTVIGSLDPVVGAFVAWDGEDALAQADEIDRRLAAGGDVGPLAGVPVGVKDLEDAAGFTTTSGSAVHRDDPPAESDSVLVARLRAAGAVIVGKTNTPEFGHKGVTDNVPFGATVNPWSTDHSPGGSSGGTAAAIAAGMIPLGTGSDGGGSIRIPAALCGLTGLKPETGRVPIAGRATPGAGLLSACGPMGRTALDTAIALDAVSGADGRDPLSVPAAPGSLTDAVARTLATGEVPRRVVWSPTLGFADVDTEIAATCRGVVEALAAAGTEVVELDEILPADPVWDWLTLWQVARFSSQGHLIGTLDWERLDPSNRQLIEAGARIDGATHARAQDACYAVNWQFEDAFTHAPLILCPTTAGRTPRIGADGTVNGEPTPGWVRFTYPVNMTRHPAGSVCAGRTDDGLPVGLQVIGRHHADAEVLAAMAAIEQLVGFDARPPIC